MMLFILRVCPTYCSNIGSVRFRPSILAEEDLFGAVRMSGVVPISCLICCINLDCMGLSFLPCLCGFRLCLYRHKRIFEEDGAAQGAGSSMTDAVDGEAMLDGGSLPIQLARSCSTITRSMEEPHWT